MSDEQATPNVAPPGDVTAQAERSPAAQQPDGTEPETRTARFVREVLSSSWLMTLAAIVVALVLSAVLIAAADTRVQETAGYVFARPSDFFGAVWESVYGAYRALFRGALYDFEAGTLTRAIRPMTESMVFATPLILAGLGIAIAFRAGLFNIGGQGQIIAGAIAGAYLGFGFDLPVVLHVTLAVLGAALGGAIWGGIAGVLKARTGANEVIVTIMLNNIAVYLIAWLLTTDAFQMPGSSLPKSPPIPTDSAALPLLLPAPFRLHAGFLLAIAATVLVWWLLERSTIGFELRAVGANANAARTAGMSVARVTIFAMVAAGALAGLAGAAQVLGTQGELTTGVAASFGFDALTVALLGRSRPLGTFLAGLLFGALKAGGFLMQSSTQTPIDIILVMQSVIVLLIAAPPLVRSIFRLPAPGVRRPQRRAPALKEAAA